jgi:hypothetical protein
LRAAYQASGKDQARLLSDWHERGEYFAKALAKVGKSRANERFA